jgi:hydrogenase maturation factor
MSQTWRKVKTITSAVTAAEDTAAKKFLFIGTGVPATATGSFAYVLGITRSGVDYTFKAKHVYSTVSGAVVIEDNSADYVLTDGDVVTVIGTYI